MILVWLLIIVISFCVNPWIATFIIVATYSPEIVDFINEQIKKRKKKKKRKGGRKKK